MQYFLSLFVLHITESTWYALTGLLSLVQTVTVHKDELFKMFTGVFIFIYFIKFHLCTPSTCIFSFSQIPLSPTQDTLVVLQQNRKPINYLSTQSFNLLYHCSSLTKQNAISAFSTHSLSVNCLPNFYHSTHLSSNSSSIVTLKTMQHNAQKFVNLFLL